MVRMDSNQQAQIRELVAELTVDRARDALLHVGTWDASGSKLQVLGAIASLCEMRSQHFGDSQRDHTDFLELAADAGHRAQITRLRLIVGRRSTEAASDGHQKYVELLSQPQVVSMLEFPREVALAEGIG